MFRTLSNKLVGREKVIDEETSFADIIGMLRFLSEDARLEIRAGFCYPFARNPALKGVTPDDAIKYLNKEFMPMPDISYTRAWHQMFAGWIGEKHYIKLQHGGISVAIGQQIIFGSPYEEASLEYLVVKAPVATKNETTI